MISVQDAIDILFSHRADYGTEMVSIHHALNRVLRENIIADSDMPSFDRVAMDGIAIQFDAYQNNIRSFTLSGMAAAGTPQMSLDDGSNCIEIMTGSIAPLNADTIIPYEWLSLENAKATIIKGNPVKGQNIHRKGTDRKNGDLLIPEGRVISPGEIGVLASVGKSNVSVSRLPKILIISTGNELVEIDEEPLPHQLRMSNVYQLRACLQEMSIKASTNHFQDDYELIINSLETFINAYDVLIISGGISEGKFDHIPKALEASDVKQHFYKVKQKPGKPFWFGRHQNGCTVFGIPGNPVSSFLCFIRYIKPWLESCMQQEIKQQTTAKLSEDVSFVPDLTYFLTVKLQQNENAELIAVPLKGHGSGDLSNLVETDAFIELPADKQIFKKEEVYPVFRFQ